MSRPLGDSSLEHLRQVSVWPLLDDPRYEIVERIGEGGMSVVYRARDHELQRDVALKLIRSTDDGKGLSKRIEREARILAALEHPCIVPIHDVGACSDGRIYYVMKLVDGRRFDREIARLDSLHARVRLFERVCEAVAFAHSRGFLHRDLKPGNIMVGAFGEVLLLDWGVAKRIDEPEATGLAGADTRVDEGHTRAGTILGTPGFMSPEQAAGQLERVDHRSDEYALGRILHDLASPSPLPARLRAIAETALRELPEERYPSVDAFAEDLRRFLDGGTPLVYRERWPERVLRFASRNRTLLLLFAAYLLTRVFIGWLSN